MIVPNYFEDLSVLHKDAPEPCLLYPHFYTEGGRAERNAIHFITFAAIRNMEIPIL